MPLLSTVQPGCTHTDTHTHTNTHAYTHTHTHKHSHKYTHILIYTHTHTQTLTDMWAKNLVRSEAGLMKAIFHLKREKEKVREKKSERERV